jgi:hypothetical protein
MPVRRSLQAGSDQSGVVAVFTPRSGRLAGFYIGIRRQSEGWKAQEWDDLVHRDTNVCVPCAMWRTCPDASSGRVWFN